MDVLEGALVGVLIGCVGGAYTSPGGQSIAVRKPRHGRAGRAI